MLKLGKAAAKEGGVRLKFADYVDTSKLPTPPAEFGHDKLVGSWPGLANCQTDQCPDPVGDCAIADALHGTQLWNLECGIAIPLNDACAIKNYSAVTGYNPADPTTDQGTCIADLIQYRKSTGLVDAAGRVHKIGAAVRLDSGNWEQLLYAMYLFDGVTIGIDMPQQWMEAFAKGGELVTWDAVKSPKSLGGHAITGVAFRDNLARIITWGSDIVGITEKGYAQSNDETYAYFSTERLKNGIDINGFDADKLLSDLPLLDDIPSRTEVA